MRLLIIRHADAGDAEEFAKTGKPDSQRPLSEKGHRQMERGVAGLLKLVDKLDVIASSPYVRARQTADAVAKGYDAAIVETRTLEPDEDPDAFARWLRHEHPDSDVVAAVGHEPHLSTLVTWLVCGERDSRVDMKKGGACLLQFDAEVAKGAAVLRWLMGPKELAAIG